MQSPRVSTCTLAILFVVGGCEGRVELEPLVSKLTADRDSIVFAETYVGGVRSDAVTLASTGTALAQLDEPRVDAPFAASDAPDGLVPGAQARLDIEFRPVTAGAVTATLVIASDAEGGDVIVALEGTGLAPLDCDDDNDCTDETFDAQAGVCIRTNRSGACDDTSACTNNDRCSDGDCVGDAIVCADSVSCTTDLCDPAVGCVFIGDDDECDDGDPCSLDSCDPGSLFGDGCAHGAAPDGTPCGDFVQCETIDICIAQSCVAVDIPDGIPCTDGDVCTLGDVCADTLCVGTPSTAPATVVTESVRFSSTQEILVLGDHLVVASGRSMFVLSLETQQLVGRLDDVEAGELVAQPGTARFAATVGSELSFVRLDDPAAPLLEAQLTFAETTRIAGVTPTDVYVCIGVDLFSFSWADLIATPLEDEGLCEARAQFLDGTLAFTGDTVSNTTGPKDPFVFFTLDSGGARRRGEIVSPTVDGILTTRFVADGAMAAVLWLKLTEDGLEQTIELIDLSNPDEPLRFELDDAVSASDGVVTIALSFPSLYVGTDEGVNRFDVTVFDAPVLDEWRLSPGSRVRVADDDHVIAVRGSLLVASATATGLVPTAPLVSGLGSIESLVSGPTTTVAVSSLRGIIPFDDASVGSDPALIPLALSENADSFVFEVDDVRGLYTLPLRLVAGDVPPVPTDIRRLDEREPLRASNDGSNIVTVIDSVAIAAPLNLGPLPDEANGLRAVSLAGCSGIGVTDCVGPLCVPNATPFLVRLSACAAAFDIVATAVIPLVITAPLDIISSTHHGTHVSMLATNTAVLVDLATATAIEVEMPELDGAVFASAGFDGSSWLVLSMYANGSAPARAVLFDVSSGSAVRAATFDVGAAAPVPSPALLDVAPRVLGVFGGRAYVSDWDPLGVVEEGHSIAVFDLEVDPPVQVDSIAIASEPVDMVARPSNLVVARVDGLSVVTPSCD